MLGRILYRCQQFYAGMFSVYAPGDAAFAKSYLNAQELALFNRLPGFEKKHAVVVAQKMLEAGKLHPELDSRKLVKLGLLHDIGKIAEKNSILTKSILVLIRFFIPALYDWLAAEGKSNPRFRKYYVHKHHGAVGAKILSKMGESSEIVAMIKKHDPRVEPFGPENPVELKILQDADSTY